MVMVVVLSPSRSLIGTLIKLDRDFGDKLIITLTPMVIMLVCDNINELNDKPVTDESDNNGSSSSCV